MKLSSLFALAGLAVCAVTQAVPAVARDFAEVPPTLNVLRYITGNGSIVEANVMTAFFGRDNPLLKELCDNWNYLDAHWHYTMKIPGDFPDARKVVCNPPGLNESVAALEEPLTNQFISEVLQAGNKTLIEGWQAFMCSFMRDDVLIAAHLNPTQFFSAICPPPMTHNSTDPIGPNPPLNSSVMAQFRQHNSKTFGRWLVSFYGSNVTGYQNLCRDFDKYENNAQKLGIDFAVVKHEFCTGLEGSSIPSDIKWLLLGAMGDIFKVMMFNAAGENRLYASLLCTDIDVPGLNDIGFNGTGFQQDACEASKPSWVDDQEASVCNDCRASLGNCLSNWGTPDKCMDRTCTYKTGICRKCAGFYC